MIIRLLLATGITLAALAPRQAAAADNAQKLAEKEAARIASECAKEAAKDLRDGARGRTFPRPDNAWDALCAPPPPPPPPADELPPAPLPPEEQLPPPGSGTPVGETVF